MVIKTMKSQSMIMGSSRKIQYLESDLNIFDDMFYSTMYNMKNYLELLLIIVCLGVSKLIILFRRFHQGLD